MRGHAAAPYDLPAATPVVPLHSRLRATATTGEARGPSGLGSNEPAQVRQAFLPPEIAAQLARPIDEHPEFRRHLDAARARAEQEGRQAAQAQVDDAVARYAAAIEALDRAVETARKPRPSDIADLALAVAHAIVGYQVGVDATFLAQAIAQAIDGIEGPAREEPLVVRLCPGDLDRIHGLAPELKSRVQMVKDSGLSPGGFVLENADRVVDGTVDARLDAVRMALVTALAQASSAEPHAQDASAKEEP